MSLLSLELNFPKSHKPAKLSAVLSKESSCAVLVFLVCSWLHQQLLFLISLSRFQLFAKPVQFLFFSTTLRHAPLALHNQSMGMSRSPHTGHHLRLAEGMLIYRLLGPEQLEPGSVIIRISKKRN